MLMFILMLTVPTENQSKQNNELEGKHGHGDYVLPYISYVGMCSHNRKGCGLY